MTFRANAVVDLPGCSSPRALGSGTVAVIAPVLHQCTSKSLVLVLSFPPSFLPTRRSPRHFRHTTHDHHNSTITISLPTSSSSSTLCNGCSLRQYTRYQYTVVSLHLSDHAGRTRPFLNQTIPSSISSPISLLLPFTPLRNIQGFKHLGHIACAPFPPSTYGLYPLSFTEHIHTFAIQHTPLPNSCWTWDRDTKPKETDTMGRTLRAYFC